jgi:nucleotide-binding universal stress UspA family protein
MPPEYFGWSLADEFSLAASDRARMRIVVLQTGAALRTGATVFVNAGNPAKVVSQAAKEFNADLLVMGRHSGAGIAGNLRQHAYSILRDSPCPVISV